MGNQEHTPQTNNDDPVQAVRNSFYDDPELADRAQNPEHLDYLVDAEVARLILENLPADTSAAEEQWARDNVQHAKRILYAFEANGFRRPVSNDEGPNIT